MTLELPQGRNANVGVVRVVVAVDDEANRAEAPNNYLIALKFLFTARKGAWIMAK